MFCTGFGTEKITYEIIQDTRYTPYVNDKECFARVLVQKKEERQNCGNRAALK